MRLAPILIPALFIVAACKGSDKPPRKEVEERGAAPRAAAPAAPPTPPSAPSAAPPAAPEPSTPEEIDLALKAAMVDGRDADVIRYCELAGIDGGKVGGQTQLGCTLAACRAEQADKARAWSKALPKPLRKQAIQICLANKVTL
jgi:hypothetical protein